VVIPYRRFGRFICPIYSVQVSRPNFGFLTLEDGINRFFRSFGKELSLVASVIVQESAVLILFAAEAWTHACVCCGLHLTRHISTYAITRLGERSSHRLSAIQRLCWTNTGLGLFVHKCSFTRHEITSRYLFITSDCDEKNNSEQCTDLCVFKQASLFISADELGQTYGA